MTVIDVASSYRESRNLTILRLLVAAAPPSCAGSGTSSFYRLTRTGQPITLFDSSLPYCSTVALTVV